MNDRQAKRERLTDAVLNEIGNELDILIRTVPDIADGEQQPLKAEAVAEAQRILDSLSTDELRSQSALERFIETMVAETRMKLHLLLFEQRRKKL